MFVQQKSLRFSKLSQCSQINFFVRDLTGLMERFYCIATGRTPFWSILVFENNKIENRAISGVIASSL